MFRESANARTVLRAVIAAGIAVLAALKVSIGDGLTSEEWVDLVYSGVGAIALYLGIGAVLPQAEPFFVRKLEGAEVPVPPATVDDEASDYSRT